jgi:hypothetical protein
MEGILETWRQRSIYVPEYFPGKNIVKRSKDDLHFINKLEHVKKSSIDCFLCKYCLGLDQIGGKMGWNFFDLHF